MTEKSVIFLIIVGIINVTMIIENKKNEILEFSLCHK